MDDFLHDPSLVFYADFAKHDAATFMSDDHYGHLCTRTGAVWRLNGHYFDGSDDYISIPKEALNPLTSYTFEFWVYDLGKANGRLLNNYEAGAVNYMYGPSSNNGVIEWYVRNNASLGWKLGLVAPSAWSFNEWHHLCLTWDGSTTTNAGRIEVDGLLVKEGTATEAAVACDGTIDWRMGYATNDSWPFNGTVREFRAYSRVLTPGERQRNRLATKRRYK